MQWFSGTILTGLCGAALMGGAVFAALDGETNFATVPERVEVALRGAGSGIGDRIADAARKTDRLPPAGEANAARQVIRVSTTSRGVGNREIVRVRPFVRVAGNLSLSVSELSANIPPFNPQKMLAQSEAASRPPPKTPAPSPMPRSRSSPATSPAPCRGRRSRRCCRSTMCSRACATPPAGIGNTGQSGTADAPTRFRRG